MGLLEQIEQLNLSDEEKAKLKSEYQSEVDPLKSERDSLKAKTRIDAVEDEIAGWGLSDHPGLAKYVRRTLLSPDSEEPGAVLLSDSDMGLTGEKATGATGREETSVASVVRNIFNLMPKNQEGKLNLSDQALAVNDSGRPGTGEEETPEQKSEGARERLAKATGKRTKRTGKRYGEEIS